MNDARKQGLLDAFVRALDIDGQDGTGFKAPRQPDGNATGRDVADFARPLQAARTSKWLAGTIQITWVAHPSTTFGLDLDDGSQKPHMKEQFLVNLLYVLRECLPKTTDQE